MNTDRDRERRDSHYNHSALLTLPIEDIKRDLPQRLYCHGNYLTELPADLPDSIIILDCSENYLTSLPEKLPTNLKYLYCLQNNIYNLPANLPLNIVELNMRNCPLKSLPNNFCKYACLIRMHLLRTLLTELPDLPESLNEFSFYAKDALFNLINSMYFAITKPPGGRITLNNAHVLKINAINSQRRTQARTRLIAPAIAEHYARRTMHPSNLAPLLADPDADVSEFMDAYVAGL
jgi:hypothetical protein